MSKESIREMIEEWLKGEEWKYEVMDDGEVIKTGLSGLECLWGRVKLICFLKDDHVTCYTIAPINIPEDMRQAVADAITRANYGLDRGNFEMDFNDGEVRYKTQVSLADLENAPKDAVSFLYSLGISMAERYGDAIMKVMLGSDPKKAIDEAEKPKKRGN